MSMTQNVSELAIPTQTEVLIPRPLDREIVGGFAVRHALQADLPADLVDSVQDSFNALRGMAVHPASAKKELGRCLAYTLIDEIDESTVTNVDSHLRSFTNSLLRDGMENRRVDPQPNNIGRVEVWKGYDIRSKRDFVMHKQIGALVMDDYSIMPQSVIWSLKVLPPSNNWGWV